MSALGQKGNMCGATDVRFAPESGHVRRKNKCPLSANSGHLFIRLPVSAPDQCMGIVIPNLAVSEIYDQFDFCGSLDW